MTFVRSVCSGHLTKESNMQRRAAVTVEQPYGGIRFAVGVNSRPEDSSLPPHSLSAVGGPRTCTRRCPYWYASMCLIRVPTSGTGTCETTL